MPLSKTKMRGALFESFVMMMALKDRLNQGENSPLYFYRDSKGKEVDVLMTVVRTGRLVPPSQAHQPCGFP